MNHKLYSLTFFYFSLLHYLSLINIKYQKNLYSKIRECCLVYEDQDPNHHKSQYPYLYFKIIIINIKELMSEKQN